MGKPVVTLENQQDVYDYYLEHQQNRLTSKAAYAALSVRFRPRVSYADGAREAIEGLLAGGGSLIIAVNHLSDKDQYILAATAWRSPLRSIIGRTRVLAKDELFADPKQRRQIDMMGGIPVFRGKNHGMRAVADAGRRMMDISAERLARGDSLAIFPEGTCNLLDPAQVQRVNSGIGHIAARAIKLGAALALLPLGIRYGGAAGAVGSVGAASVYIGNPVREFPAKPMEIARLVQCGLQDVVDAAGRNLAIS
ncbi:lysophospholipid acyltransferase family protein [Tomitella biformata]|uniref:lysophospholipid acyltransferase family protein n=1 Tax=Tomitella biformata TaxID=630403 RepID=UPI0004674715|nr:lysophospholipid acyltransferase family protein [Tomitella biformata]